MNELQFLPDSVHGLEQPVGLLEACADIGRDDYKRCVVFHSLSKRSNLPGLRSGFVAGDAAILERYFLYRTYHGCAMPAHVQHVSELAWSDETHVVDNRARYREKFTTVTPLYEKDIVLSVKSTSRSQLFHSSQFEGCPAACAEWYDPADSLSVPVLPATVEVFTVGRPALLVKVFRSEIVWVMSPQVMMPTTVFDAIGVLPAS